MIRLAYTTVHTLVRSNGYLLPSIQTRTARPLLSKIFWSEVMMIWDLPLGLANHQLTRFFHSLGFIILSKITLIVESLDFCSDPLVGEELYTQMGFFLFSQFWPIDIFIVEKC